MSDTGTRSPQRKLQDNIRRVRERMAEACRRANRDPQSVRLIAVTKTVEMDVIRNGVAQGLSDLGESQVQQLARRASMLAESAKRRRVLGGGDDAAAPTWHMIGHLQRNKVKKVLEWTNTIHSVDSLRLAEDLDDAGRQLHRAVDVLLQINVAGERSKFGVAVGAVDVLVEQIQQMPHLRLIGLMTMMPLVPEAEEVRSGFRRVREIAEELHTRERVGPAFCELSMGMTNDFEVAIEEGSTMVRVGSALFQGLAAQRDEATSPAEIENG